jgi:hypothetical protein
MITRNTFPLIAVVCLLQAFGIAAESTPPAPAGSVDFAGRVARHHWHLFGAEYKTELETLNRELREASQLRSTAGDEAAKSAAARRLRLAADRLREMVAQQPQLIRLDLTATQMKFAVTGPIEIPSDSGALLVEVKSPGEGHQFSLVHARTGRYDVAARGLGNCRRPRFRTHTALRRDHRATG